MTIKLRPGGLYKTKDGSIVRIRGDFGHYTGYGDIVRSNNQDNLGCWGFYYSGVVCGFSPNHPITIVKEIEP